ncbi:MAG: hypothetical protein MUO31_13660 [Thermodesulfovibrionales bacterium]|nr:hypothetical protein [Thermodesulfovibrionales bacterium]
MRYIIILAVCMLPLSAWGGDGNAEVKKETPATPWKDVKHAPGPKVSEIPEAYNDLMKTFAEYYDARKTGNYKKAYDLESSDFRKTMSFDLYNERLKSSAEIIAVRPLEVKPISEKEVMVRASFGYKLAAIDTVRFIQDHWVKEDNAWRHMPKEEN